jgi:hypothetical protein
MIKTIVTFAALPLALAAFSGTAAQAQPCADNFKAAGVPMVSTITYRTWDLIPNRKPAVALTALARAVEADGFDDVTVNKASGTISALQETTGSGRPQTLRVTAKASGPATRVDIVFTVQAGQIADEGATRTGMCRIIAGGRR